MIKKINTILSYIFLILASLVTIFPFVYMILVGLMNHGEVTSMPPTIIPEKLLWSNYSEVFQRAPFIRYFFNTVFVSLVTTASTVITAIFAGFALNTLTFKFKNIVIGGMITLLMIPSEAIIFTNYNTVAKWGLLDSYTGLIIPFLTSIFYTYYLMTYLKGIPDTYYKSAKINGASDLEYIFKIMIPLSKSALVTIGLLTFIASWNSFLWPLLVSNSNDYRLLNNGLSAFASESGSDTQLQMAAATLTVVPILIIYFIFRKEIIKGVSRDGIKG